MSRQMENAQKLYLRGIRDGAVDEVLSTYMGKTYTQHSTGVKDGKVGFAEFALFDIFRIEDGKIAEHWDVAEPVPPRAELANSGKF